MRKLTHLALAAVLAVAALTAATGPAAAKGGAPITFSGTGTHQPPEWGLTRVQADIDGKVLDGAFFAGLRIPAMPAPGECGQAWMNFAVHDGGHWYDFVSLGELCAESPQPPTSVVFAVYTGDFDLYDSSRPGFADTQGWVSVRLATDGTASVEVYPY